MHLNPKLAAVVVSASLMAGNALAATTNDSVVYEKVDTFSGSVHFTDSFSVTRDGTYEAIFTDFEFTSPFTRSGLNITTSTSSLGRLSGPGNLSFDATPGDYYVSLFAAVAEVSAEEKRAMVEETKHQNAVRWKQGLTAEKKQAHKDWWNSLTREERQAHAEKVERRAERQVEQQLASMADGIGQYGVQIALAEASAALPGGGNVAAVVPLPGALWLFATGLIGLAGFGRSRRARC